jgi:serine/threonine-protein kinase RsbW
MNELELRFVPTLDNAQSATIAAREIAAVLLRTAGVESIDDHGGFLSEVELATGEACCNAVKHNPEDLNINALISVVFQLHDSKITIVVSDGNDAFNFSEREPDFDAIPEDGYGIYLMRKVMNKVSYQREKGRNFVIMEKKI